MLKRAQRDSGQAVRSAIIQLREMAEGDLTKAFDNFVRSVVSKEPGFCVVRQEYSRMPPKQLLDVLFQKINVLYSSVNYLQELHQVGRGQIREVSRGGGGGGGVCMCLRGLCKGSIEGISVKYYKNCERQICLV